MTVHMQCILSGVGRNELDVRRINDVEILTKT